MSAIDQSAALRRAVPGEAEHSEIAFGAEAPRWGGLWTEATLPDQFPAPAAQTWSAVAIALGQGLSSLQSIKL